eukprot:292349-Rhodomonas_salina.1
MHCDSDMLGTTNSFAPHPSHVRSRDPMRTDCGAQVLIKALARNASLAYAPYGEVEATAAEEEMQEMAGWQDAISSVENDPAASPAAVAAVQAEGTRSVSRGYVPTRSMIPVLVLTCAYAGTRQLALLRAKIRKADQAARRGEGLSLIHISEPTRPRLI